MPHGSIVARAAQRSPTAQLQAQTAVVGARIALTTVVSPEPTPPAGSYTVVDPPTTPNDEAAPATDTLTILTARGGKVLTKIHTLDGTTAYDKASRFDARVVEVRDLDELHAQLEAQAGDPHACVVRGIPTKRRRQADNVNRRYLDDQRRKEPPDLTATDHCWIAIDADDWPASPDFDPSDHESRQQAVRQAIRENLPPCFHAARCVVQWSASAGLDGWQHLKLHLWFWLSRHACDRSLKQWLRRSEYVDTAVLQPSQPHYVSRPQFHGIEDPVGDHRLELLDGEPTVTLPEHVVDLDTWTRREQDTKARQARGREERKRKLATGDLEPITNERTGAYALRVLDGACDAMEAAPHHSRHPTFRDRSWQVATYVSAGVLDRGLAEARLIAAGMSHPDADERHVRETVTSALDRAPAADLTHLARPARRRDELPEPPADDVPHTVTTLQGEPTIEPLHPATSTDKTAELARQTATINGWVETEVLRCQVAREAEKIRQRLLEAEGLEKIIGADTAADLDTIRCDIAARRAVRLTEVETEIAKLTESIEDHKAKGRATRSSSSKLAKLEAEVEQLLSTIDVRKEARLRKTALTKQARREALARRGIDRLSVNGDRPVVTGCQGTGKTKTLLRAVTEITDLSINVHVYVQTTADPEKAKAYEVRAEYYRLLRDLEPLPREEAHEHEARVAGRCAKALPAVIVLGRGARDPQSADGDAMCPRYKTAGIAHAGRSGVNISRDICGNCALSGGCGHMRQRRELEEQRERGGCLYVMAHNYMAIPTPRTLAPADLVVIDESPLSTMAGLVGFTPERITHQKIPQHLSTARETLLLVQDAIVDVDHPDVAQRAMHEAGVTLEKLKYAKRALDSVAKEDLAEVNGTMADETIRQRIEEYEKTECGLVSLLLRQIIRESPTNRDGFNSVTYEPDAIKTIDGERRRVAWVYVSYLKNFRPGAKRPVLTLDGTADRELLRPILGKRLTETRISIERNAEIVQVRGKSFSSQSIDGCTPRGEPLGEAPAKRAERLRREILELVGRVPGERKVVISTKRAEAVLSDGLDRLQVAHDHYGAIRGSNRFEDCDVGILIGRERPGAQTIERLAGAYAAQDLEPLHRTGAYVRATRGRRLADGQGEAEEVWIHTDERCQRVLEQLREREIEQAADRLRLIFNASPKQLFVLCSLPLDLTINRSLRWSELVSGSRLDRMVADLPDHVEVVTAATLAAHRGMSVRKAREALGTFRTQTPIDLIGKKVRKVWTAVVYSRGGRPGKALILAGRDPYEALLHAGIEAKWVRLQGAPKPLPRPPIAAIGQEPQHTSQSSTLSEFREGAPGAPRGELP